MHGLLPATMAGVTVDAVVSISQMTELLVETSLLATQTVPEPSVAIPSV
ncbi:MAG: hypothetical protein JRH11_01620 [Deltaproteobacteria bacterium]|nr:hypothetical protein [Deltaproteobacteria bacterium]